MLFGTIVRATVALEIKLDGYRLLADVMTLPCGFLPHAGTIFS